MKYAAEQDDRFAHLAKGFKINKLVKFTIRKILILKYPDEISRSQVQKIENKRRVSQRF